MSINRSYAVFGLGRYGLSVARELVNNGADVLAVDQNQSIVNAAIADIPFCKCADITDPDVIRNLGLSGVDVVIIAMASNLEAAVMATMLCKEAGVKTVIVKCANEVHGKILSRVGADKVVIPEKESGTRLAKNLLSSGFVDVIELSEDVSLVEMDVRADWAGKTLIELNLRKKYGINVVAIRCGSDLQINVDPTMQLDKTMQLVVITNKEKINKLKG